jgi:hypothetical protein
MALSAGSGGGSAGAPMVVQKLCATKQVLATPLIVSFESYDGLVTADEFAFYFGGTTPGMHAADATLGGFYKFSGVETASTMKIGAGYLSNYGLSFDVVQENVWGGGFGIWLQPTCVDATSFKGVSFWIRGVTPTNTFSVSLDMDSTTLPSAADPAGGGTCPGTMDTCKAPIRTELPLAVDWTQVMIPWAEFSPGTSGATAVTATGDNVTGITFSFAVSFVESEPESMIYVPVPGDINVVVDDLSFIP